MIRMRIVCFLFFWIYSAQAAEFNEFAVFPYTWISGSQGLESGSKISLGLNLGFTVNVDIDQKYSVEGGFVYSARSFSQNSTDYKFRTAQLPVMLRYKFNPNFSAGGGFYYSRGVGNVIVNQPNQSQRLVGYPSLGFDNSDIGITLGGRYKKVVYEFIHIFLDARFLFGLNNISQFDQVGSVYLRDLQIWTGFGFTL